MDFTWIKVPEDRTIEFSKKLASCEAATAGGVEFAVTSAPHRNPDHPHLFYEVWVAWNGGSLRTSTAIHNDVARDALIEFLLDMTGNEDLSGMLHDLLDKYEWQ